MTDTTAQSTANPNGSAVPASPVTPTYTYALLPNSTSIIRSDNVSFPPNPLNSEYQTYQDWLAAGNKPTPAPGPTPAELLDYLSKSFEAHLAAGQTFNVAAAGATALSVLCDGLSSTRADLGMLGLYGQAYPNGSKQWLDNTGKVTTLTSAEIISLVTQAGTWISDMYAAFASAATAIAGPSPSITTTAEIDSYAWPAT